MRFTNEVSDEAVLREMGSRIARHRLNRNLTQTALAREAGVSQRTVVRVEHGQSTQVTNLIRILRALRVLENFEALVPEPAISPIQQLEMKGKSRKRASREPRRSDSTALWSWGDED